MLFTLFYFLYQALHMSPLSGVDAAKETKYDAPQGVSKSGICSKSGCREEGEPEMFKIKREPAEYESKSLRLPVDMIEKVQKLADANNISFNKVITQCVDYALDNLDEKDDK